MVVILDTMIPFPSVMKHGTPFALILPVSLLLLTALSPLSGAVSVTIPPGEEHSETFLLFEGTVLRYSWTASTPVQFELRSPSGSTLQAVLSSRYHGAYEAQISGTYTLVWINPHSGAVDLDYEVSTISLDGGLQETLSSLFLGVLVVAVAIVVVVLVVVVFVLLREHRTSPQRTSPLVHPQTQAPHPVTGGNCHACGFPTDSAAAFCQRCGARLR